MRNDTSTLILVCAKALQLARPVELRIRTKARRDSKDLAGYYEPQLRAGKIIRHIVILNLGVIATSNYSLNAVIAHELIHACQMEHGFFDENHHHDKKFQKMAEKLREILKDIGYSVEPLYDEKVDTD